MLTHLSAAAAFAFAAAVARLEASWFEIPLLLRKRDLPYVSIVVPARNEERSIEACVRSLLAQRWLDFELIVVDDRSDDATPAILARLAIEDDRLRVVRGQPLPEGWVGKPWALQQGAAIARGEWVLFTDADSEHAPLGVASALAFAIDAGVDALTIGPYQRLESFWEKAALPSILGMIMIASGSLALVNDPMTGYALANGQYILVRREALAALGGHAALRDKIAEDLEFARLLKNDGRFRMLLAGGTDLARVRMYHSLSEIWAGFTKNMALGVDDPREFFVAMAACGLISFVPPLLAWRSLKAGRPAEAAEAIAAAALLVTAASRGARLTRHNPALAFFHPLGMSVLTAIGVNSGLRWYSGRGVEWRGRVYRR
jgi:chlorobactene glucosyltransferase